MNDIDAHLNMLSVYKFQSLEITTDFKHMWENMHKRFLLGIFLKGFVASLDTYLAFTTHFKTIHNPFSQIY